MSEMKFSQTSQRDTRRVWVEVNGAGERPVPYTRSGKRYRPTSVQIETRTQGPLMGLVESLPCDSCAGPIVPWRAPDEVWNLVMGGPEASDDPGGMLCANCFLWRADGMVPTPVWRVSPTDGGDSRCAMTAPRIEPGQRWRRKSDGVEVEVVRLDPWGGVVLTFGGGTASMGRPTLHRDYDLIDEAPR